METPRTTLTAEDVVRRNHVKVFGRGQTPMIFAHGFGCDQHMWRFVTTAFEKDYSIVLFDYVGSGSSDLAAYSPSRYATLEGYAEDLLEICRALDLRDAIVVGHSVSSIVAVLAAKREPERFSRLILIGPSPRYVNDPPEYVSTAKVFDMLMAVPKFGRVKAARFLNQCRISQSKTVGGLSERQRSELIALFDR